MRQSQKQTPKYTAEFKNFVKLRSKQILKDKMMLDNKAVMQIITREWKEREQPLNINSIPSLPEIRESKDDGFRLKLQKIDPV